MIRFMSEMQPLSLSLSVCVCGSYALAGLVFLLASRAADAQRWAPL